MYKKLIEYSARELLERFGAGSHKPGSGSAAAFEGMLSAQLIRTVINLTNEEKRRKKYQEWLPKFLEIYKEIENRIYPDLVRLFQEDSKQFDIVINLRDARDREEDWIRKNQLKIEALEALRPATELPIEIAKLSIELANSALFVFDYGFKSARGDSNGALKKAVSAIFSCLSIIQLNLQSFTSDDWTDKIRREAKSLKDTYNRLSVKAEARLDQLTAEADEKNAYDLEIRSILSGLSNESKLSYVDIEKTTQRLQNALWKYRNLIWKKNKPEDPIDILQPDRVLKALGYEFCQISTLGQHEVQGQIVEIAGLIDKSNKFVAISEQFAPETRLFTTAHELGHALLHKQTVLHRDRAIDGSAVKIPRNRQELQADKFAACFLMPEKQVRDVFQTLFSMEKFVINEATVFALNQTSVQAFRAECKDLRGLARFIAAAEFFNGKSFISMAKLFRVSVGAMAIRLEELGLVEY